MGKVAKRRNPGFLFLDLLMISILISAAPHKGLFFYSGIFVLASIISQRSIFQSFKSAPLLAILVAVSALSHAITSTSWQTGLFEGLRLMLLLSFSFLFIEVADSTELSSSLGKMLSPIIGKKAWVLSSMIMVTLSMIPMILESAKEMFHARQSRNENFLAHPIKALSDYSISLMKLLFKRSEEYYDALLCRGFKEDQERIAPPISSSDTITLMGVIGLCILVLIKRH